MPSCLYTGLCIAFPRFSSHPWHYHVLFSGVQDEHTKLNPDTILHLLASSTWATNLRILDRNIKQTGLEDIRRPSISINGTLHNERAELLQMPRHVKMTLEWLPPSENRSRAILQRSPQRSPTRLRSQLRCQMRLYCFLCTGCSVPDSATVVERASPFVSSSFRVSLRHPFSREN